MMTTSSADLWPGQPERSSVSLDELARRKHVQPIRSAEDLAQDDVFDSDEELDAFLAHVYTVRRADLT
jgi:hypothetical protein